MLGDQPVHLGLDLLVFLRLALGELLDRLLLDPLESIESAVAAHRVLDDLLQLHSRGVERQQDRAAFDVGRQVADMLALQHVGNLVDRVAVCWRMNFRRAVYFVERGAGWRDARHLGLRSHRGGDVGYSLSGASFGLRRSLLRIAG